jgi:hypothetical protein
MVYLLYSFCTFLGVFRPSLGGSFLRLPETIVELGWDEDIDDTRPRIPLILENGQRISALFDTGASKSVLTSLGPRAYIDKGASSDLGTCKYMKFAEAPSLNVIKVICETAHIVGTDVSGLSIRFFISEEEYPPSQQHLAADPDADFTSAIGGEFGYLPRYTSLSSPIAWLIVGAGRYQRFCAGPLVFLPLEREGSWQIAGRLSVREPSSGANAAQSETVPETVNWFIDTGGLSVFHVTLPVLRQIVSKIEKGGMSVVTRRRGEVRERYFVENCAASMSFFPILVLEIGGFKIEVPPFQSVTNLFYALGPDEEGRCRLDMSVTKKGSTTLDLSTDVMDKFFWLFDANNKRIGICRKQIPKDLLQIPPRSSIAQ